MRKALFGFVVVGIIAASGYHFREKLLPHPASDENKALIFNQKLNDALSDLKIQDLRQGTGAMATAKKNVKVHYTGWLVDGRRFDSSVDRKAPIEFPLGTGQVMPGWDHGIVGMREGGKRKLTVPPFLGYGEKPVGDLIPGNSTLVFEIELLKVTDPAPPAKAVATKTMQKAQPRVARAGSSNRKPASIAPAKAKAKAKTKKPKKGIR